MKRLITITILALSLLVTASCVEPLDIPLTDNSLSHTTWVYQGYDFISEITFMDRGEIYHYEHYYDDGSTWNYQGSYGFNGAQGSAVLNCFGQKEYFNFTVYGNRLTVDFEGDKIVHEQVQFRYPE